MATTSRMCSHTTFAPIDIKICSLGHVTDVINLANLFENQSKGFRATGPRKMSFLIDNIHRPYNSVIIVIIIIILLLLILVLLLFIIVK